MRKVGMLMPVASLPGRHGIGDFGKESYNFVDLLKEAKAAIWQMLPLNPLGYGNSPYQPYSSCAGDELYINLDKLCEEGLLKRVPDFHSNATHIDYQAVREFKGKYLKKAFKNFKPDAGYKKFTKMDWVYNYAVFLTLKKQNNLVSWNEWPVEQQNWIKDHKYDLTPLKEDIEYEMFVQYEFYKQWMELKKYANKNGIKVMGDIPIYVGIDSLDVWSGQENFLLGADGKPTFIAGVPPDYFSATGQRWGNPIYDWDYMEKDGFKFWLNRLDYSSKLFDIIRIDHFRAFDSYWKIPATCETAVDGEWNYAPGYKLFDTVFKVMPDINIIVEDLGDLRPEVLELRDHYEFKGMRIVQFCFTENDVADGEYTDTHNLVLYTGTHDNDTINGWYKSLSRKEKNQTRRFLDKAGIPDGAVSWRMVSFTLSQDCYMAILPYQDVCDLGAKTRLNLPGTLGSPNWEWKAKNLDDFAARTKEFAELVKNPVKRPSQRKKKQA
jgi:4-alpha-glucanotransferase